MGRGVGHAVFIGTKQASLLSEGKRRLPVNDTGASEVPGISSPRSCLCQWEFQKKESTVYFPIGAVLGGWGLLPGLMQEEVMELVPV